MPSGLGLFGKLTGPMVQAGVNVDAAPEFAISDLNAVAAQFPKLYVDSVTGDDANDGLTPESAYATLQAAHDAAVDGSNTIVVMIASPTASWAA